MSNLEHLTAAVVGNVSAALAEALSGIERTPSPDGIETVLDTAMITAPGLRSGAVLEKLDVIAGRVLS